MRIKLKDILLSKGFLKYFRNTSWLIVERIFRLIISLFIGVWVARYLGPEKFGLISYSQSFVAIFASFASLGINTILIREFVNEKYNSTELFGTSLIIKLFGATASILFITFSAWIIGNDRFTIYLILIISSASIFQSFNVIDLYFQSKVLSKYVVCSSIIGLFSSSVLKIFLVLNDADLQAFAYVIVFENLVVALGFLYTFLKYSNLDFLKIRFSKNIFYSLLNDSWPLILSGLVISIYMKIDQVMIKQMLGDESVGQYASAVRISEAWY